MKGIVIIVDNFKLCIYESDLGYKEKQHLLNIFESVHRTGFLRKLYHLSPKNLNGVVLHPRIPKNKLTQSNIENSVTPRVCFAPSIDRCLMALSQNLEGKEFYVHIPDGKINYSDVSSSDVPDSKITKEKWVTVDVKVKCIGKIKVISAIDKPYTFNYPNNSEKEPLCTFKWNWEWVEKY